MKAARIIHIIVSLVFLRLPLYERGHPCDSHLNRTIHWQLIFNIHSQDLSGDFAYNKLPSITGFLIHFTCNFSESFSYPAYVWSHHETIPRIPFPMSNEHSCALLFVPKNKVSASNQAAINENPNTLGVSGRHPRTQL